MRAQVLLLGCSAAAALIAGVPRAQASSHREAPFLTENPKVDATDFYLFRSYEPGRSAYVTIIANYYPLQDPYGGPSFFTLDPDALYEIMIDNNADAIEDLTFQFRFTTDFKNIRLPVGTTGNTKDIPIPLYNIGPVPGPSRPDENLNVTETYTVGLVRGPRRQAAASMITNADGGDTIFTKPSDLVGEKTFVNYADYADDYIYEISIPGCAPRARMFVGQRKDPFVVNLGELFDLINIAPDDANGTNMCDAASRDTLMNKNVTTIALEVPIACLTEGSDPVIGGWTTASLRQARVLNRRATYELAAKEGGAWTQVSRLGHPLINEVIIGLQDKNRFNGSAPVEDMMFLDYVTYPVLAKIIGIIYAAAGPLEPQLFPRNDLIEVFLSGIPSLNAPTSSGAMPSEQLRLNTATPVSDLMAADVLGYAGGDVAGFPNGRRPFDDVVDISLRVLMGALGPDVPENPGRMVPFTDCAPTSIGDYDGRFPYLRSPVAGSRRM